MKIQCDVCDKGEASVFCIADEAALCNSCDHRVHHANKLASKHHRFSLFHPPPKQAPLCDICQERRAFLFCQQDRAILCRECDVPIHKANEHTEKHNRFLLTGVKLSPNSALYSPSSSSSSDHGTNSVNNSSNSSDAVPTFNPHNNNNNNTVINKPVSQFNSTGPRTNNVSNTAAASEKATGTIIGQMMNGGDNNNHHNNTATSSISEYLIEMLPGWHVEDFLDSSSSTFGFCKNTSDQGDGINPFWDENMHSDLGSFLPENTGLWVPQAAAVPVPPLHVHPPTTTCTQSDQYCFSSFFNSISNVGFGFGYGVGGHIGSKDMVSNIKSSRKCNIDDNSFAVPQISPTSSASSKRLKTTSTFC